MRSDTNIDKIRKLMHELGMKAKGPGTVYLTGGACAVLFGWRNTTVDVDLKLEPDLVRYPSINPRAFSAKVKSFLEEEHAN